MSEVCVKRVYYIPLRFESRCSGQHIHTPIYLLCECKTSVKWLTKTDFQRQIFRLIKCLQKKYVWIIEILRNVILICFEQALTENGNTVYMSDSKGSCEAGQTPTTKSSDGSGTLQLASTGWSKNNQYMRCISNKVIEKEKNQNQISSFVKFNISERFYNRISVLSYF